MNLARLLAIFLLSLSMLLVWQIRGEAMLARSKYAPVLMYHEITPHPINGFDVSAEAFAQQLDWLQANGYRTLSMDEYIACINQGRFPKKSVLITFDDGYEGNLLYAAPELKKRGMHATFFIVTSAIGTRLERYNYMTKNELRTLAAEPLFSIGSHTCSHPQDITKIYWHDQDCELQYSKGYLEQVTGRSCRAVAYPCGHYDWHVLASAIAAGYEAGFAVCDRGLYGYDTRYTITRIYMGTDLCTNNNALFKAYVQGYHRQSSEFFSERYRWI